MHNLNAIEMNGRNWNFSTPTAQANYARLFASSNQCRGVLEANQITTLLSEFYNTDETQILSIPVRMAVTSFIEQALVERLSVRKENGDAVRSFSSALEQSTQPLDPQAWRQIKGKSAD